MGAACPVPAKADTRPAYRAAVSLARLSPPCGGRRAQAGRACRAAGGLSLSRKCSSSCLRKPESDSAVDAAQLGMAGDITALAIKADVDRYPLVHYRIVHQHTATALFHPRSGLPWPMNHQPGNAPPCKGMRG
jgi:hypothetical protein